MTQVLSVIREFDIFGSGDDVPYGIDTPKIHAQFVGISPAITFDTSNQPRLARQKERELRTLEDDIRKEFRDQLSHQQGGDLSVNLNIFGRLITTFKQRLENTLLVKDQLELESLTISGEWLTYWQDKTPLARQKTAQQQQMPSDL